MTFTGRGGYGLCVKGADDDGFTVLMAQKIVDIVCAKAVEFGADIRVNTEVTGLMKVFIAIYGRRKVGKG